MKTYFKKIQTIFLFSTISALILIGIEEYLVFQIQISTIIIGVFGGLIVGICLSLYSGLFINYNRKLWGIKILQVFSIFIISIIISTIVIFFSRFLPHGNWVELQPAPETVEKFVIEKNSIDLRVLTNTGNIFLFECKYFIFSGDDCTWQQDNKFLIEEQSKTYNPDLESYYYFTPILLIKPVESYKSYYRYPDAIETVKIVRSKDGRIFVWHRMWNPLEVIFRFISGLFFGFIIGLLTNIAVFITRKRKTP